MKIENLDFKVDFNPYNSIIFNNNLILLGIDSLKNNKMISINIEKNIIDSVFSEQIYNTDISRIFIKKDTLISYFKKSKKWKYWNEKWVDYNLLNEWIFNDKFEVIKYLYEDRTYAIISLDFGEFGGFVNFYNKISNKLYATQIMGANFCEKRNNKYIINGNLGHGTGFVDVIEVANPEKLCLLPDSLNIYLNMQKNGSYSMYLDSCQNSLLPDTLISALQNNYSINDIDLAKEIIRKKQGVKTILDTVGMLCYATFTINENLIHIIQDTNLFIGTIQNETLINLKNLYDDDFYNWYDYYQRNKNYILISFSYWQHKKRDEKAIYLIMNNNKLRKYSIY